MFVTNWISTTKIQKISEITNFFRHYFLSRTEVEVGKLAGVARTEALLELGTPVDPSHQPVERYPGGSGGEVEHGELCLPVTSVFYHNLFFLVCFCQLLLSSAW